MWQERCDCDAFEKKVLACRQSRLHARTMLQIFSLWRKNECIAHSVYVIYGTHLQVLSSIFSTKCESCSAIYGTEKNALIVATW